MLLRLPLGNQHEALDCIPIDAFMIGQIQALPVTTEQVKTAIRHYSHTLNGWPDKIAEEFKPFARQKQELTIEGNCFVGNRVVIPLKLRPALLEELHEDILEHELISGTLA